MKKLGLSLLFILFGCCISLYSVEIEDYPYQSPYDALFSQVKDINWITKSLEDKDLDVVYSALKRVGQLEIKSAKDEVEFLVLHASPQNNQDKQKLSANYRHVYYMGILVLGKIGDSQDGKLLLDLLKNARDCLEVNSILRTLPRLVEPETASEKLREYVYQVTTATDNRIVQCLVETMLSYRSKSFLVPLLLLKEKVNHGMHGYIDEAAQKLNRWAAPRNTALLP